MYLILLPCDFLLLQLLIKYAILGCYLFSFEVLTVLYAKKYLNLFPE